MTATALEGVTATRAGQLDCLLDGAREGGRIGALNRVDYSAIVKDEEGRHRPHAVLLGNIFLTVYIDLAERDLLRLGILGREGLKYRRDHLAGATPVGID